MNANFRVVLDACVLANFGLCDLFLTLAETPRLYQPMWSREILDEAQRTQTRKLGWPEELSKSWRKAVESAFPARKPQAMGCERVSPGGLPHHIVFAEFRAGGRPVGGDCTEAQAHARSTLGLSREKRASLRSTLGRSRRMGVP